MRQGQPSLMVNAPNSVIFSTLPPALTPTDGNAGPREVTGFVRLESGFRALLGLEPGPPTCSESVHPLRLPPSEGPVDRTGREACLASALLIETLGL